MLLNSDRHFNNLGVIINRETGKTYEAPIFDNRDSLLSNYSKYPVFIDERQYDAIAESVTGMPFSSSLEAQALSTKFELKINYKTLMKDLEQENESRALTILKMQLNHLEKLFRDDSIDLSNSKIENSAVDGIDSELINHMVYF